MVGTKTITVQIQMVDDYIYDCGVPRAIGCARKHGDFYKVDISKQSPSHEETLIHELRHVGRWAVGWEGNFHE